LQNFRRGDIIIYMKISSDIDELRQRLEKLTDYENRAGDIRSFGREDTICSFPYRNNGCISCMYEDGCRERSETADRKAWQMESRVMVAYLDMERELRALDKSSPDVVIKETLARVLRRIAGNRTLISDEDKAHLAEAEEIFRGLYFMTGEPQYKEEYESCRLHRIRMK
jgi:hypothetical protein